ncbi:MAG: FAD-dependent oxidoreductase [Candidatus Omnitrophica bacterium]|nr:FAD-dependent oxidoreductase [Candidatus Omnitrophota bacterium]MDD5610204.1 FAD-dependent oxidoreductase [Candidatus Omnitrophota bacterium]
MKAFSAKLIERIKRTPTIESLRFLPEERILFLPGQFLQVIFDERNPANKELNKYLSFSSSPDKQYFEITKRMSGSIFSERLKKLAPLDTILVNAPMGNSVFKPEYKKICFLIGGIGITPVISIVEYIMENKLDTDMILLYSNRNEEEIAFKSELDGWSEKNNRFKVIYSVTDCQPRDKKCLYGQINRDLVETKIPDLSERMIFEFGPPKMVEAMTSLCSLKGCSKDKIRTESFIGY